MPSFLSTTTTTTILLLLLFSIHVSSALASRRHLTLDEQDEDPLLKPPSKKKTTLTDQDQDPPLRSKKKLADFDNSHSLKPKKKVTDNDQEEATPLKPKKKAAVIEEELIKPKPKKEIESVKLKKKVAVEEEEKIIPLVKPKKKVVAAEEDSQTTKPKKKIIIAEEDEAAPLKLKKKVAEPGTSMTNPNKKVNFDNKNQTMKSKKTNSTTVTTEFTKSSNKTKRTNSTTIPTNNPKSQQSATKNPTNLRDEAAMASWFDSDEMTTIPDDLISDFRDLPSRLLPDLSRLSTTSKAYISRANHEIAKNVKPYVGHQAASTVASIASAALLALPLLLLTLVFHRIKTYLTLQRLLIFIQAYLAIYFATLAFIALVTGLEPLRFFAAASPPSYAVVQTIQTLGYVMYLVVQMLHVAAGGEGRWLGVAQMVVGLAVGVHYYAAVFHRAVAGEPPRANWKVHAVYAGCFVVICACARAERRKKAYLAGGGGDDDGGLFFIFHFTCTHYQPSDCWDLIADSEVWTWCAWY